MASIQMREVKCWEELKSPGDYMLTTRCTCCDSQHPDIGHYAGCTSPETHTGFVHVCKCGGTFASAKEHRVVQRNPLTVRASVLCPNKCHAFITNGVWVDC